MGAENDEQNYVNSHEFRVWKLHLKYRSHFLFSLPKKNNKSKYRFWFTNTQKRELSLYWHVYFWEFHFAACDDVITIVCLCMFVDCVVFILHNINFHSKLIAAVGSLMSDENINATTNYCFRNWSKSMQFPFYIYISISVFVLFNLLMCCCLETFNSYQSNVY